MRLFLASQDFGNHAARLHDLVGTSKTALVIFNAKDDYSAEQRLESVQAKKELFENAGFEFHELDLRDYFGKSEQLARYIQTQNPGLIFGYGGSAYILRKAFALSGLDKILLEDLQNDRYVYGGSSAGSVVLQPDLSVMDDSGFDDTKIMPPEYGEDLIYEGLGLINQYIVPHINSLKFGKAPLVAEQNLIKHQLPHISLRDSDAYLINGNQAEILR